METTWKDRMWHLFLVCVLGVVVSVCTSSTSSKKGTAYADFKPSDVTAVIACSAATYSSYVTTFNRCDASDSTSISSGNITLVDLVSAGFRPCAGGTVGGMGGGTNDWKYFFFFCK